MYNGNVQHRVVLELVYEQVSRVIRSLLRGSVLLLLNNAGHHSPDMNFSSIRGVFLQTQHQSFNHFDL